MSHVLAATNGERWWKFAERLMSYQCGHALWMSKTAEHEDYQEHGCRREGQRIFAGEKDITHAYSCLRLDGAEGARGICACHKGLAFFF